MKYVGTHTIQQDQEKTSISKAPRHYELICSQKWCLQLEYGVNKGVSEKKDGDGLQGLRNGILFWHLNALVELGLILVLAS